MKKIKSLFILALVLVSFNTNLPLVRAESLENETQIFLYKDGSMAIHDDGVDCVRLYGEAPNGDFNLVWTGC
jgi:hypothetical protein